MKKMKAHKHNDNEHKHCTMPPRRPTHPGELFKESFINKMNLTEEYVASCLNINVDVVNDFINCNYRCTPELAKRLSSATKTSTSLWLNMQLNLDLWEAVNMQVCGVVDFKTFSNYKGE